MTSAEANSRSLVERLRLEVERNALRTKNGIRLAAHAVLDKRTDVGLSPKEVIWRRGRSELWHYDGPGKRPGHARADRLQPHQS